MFSFERFEPLRLAHLHPTIGLAPAVIGLLADTELFTHLADVLAPAQQHVRFPQLVDDLFGVVSFRWQGSERPLFIFLSLQIWTRNSGQGHDRSLSVTIEAGRP